MVQSGLALQRTLSAEGREKILELNGKISWESEITILRKQAVFAGEMTMSLITGAAGTRAPR